MPQKVFICSRESQNVASVAGRLPLLEYTTATESLKTAQSGDMREKRLFIVTDVKQVKA
jgi:hypothetical protein